MPEFLQSPEVNEIYFQKNIPDIILKKTNDTHDSKVFTLKVSGITILTENYTYDSEGYIYVRNLGSIIEKYFTPELLILPVTIKFDDGVFVDTKDFKAIKCDADMLFTASSWTATNFLTRAYREKRTAKSRNEYLSFLQKLAFGSVTVNYKAYYLVDSVVTEKTGVMQTIAASAGDQVTTFNASLDALLTAAVLAIDTTVLQYDIWLTGTAFETAKYTFLIDYTPYRNFKHFVFVNCFGVLETFTTTGLTVNKKTNEYNLGNIDNHYRKITQDFVSEKTCNSGYLSDAEMEWIDDFIKSYTIGLYTSIGISEEITLVGVDKQDSEANELQAFSFGYRRANNNHLQITNASQGVFDERFDEIFD